MIIHEHISLAPYTTFRVGGVARYFCTVANEAELREALEFARGKRLPVFVLGGGSNVVVADAGFPGLVIKMETRGIEFREVNGGGDGRDIDGSVRATVAAGESWDAFVAETVRRGLWGLENLSGIPGTVGASPVQNIGAYGTEVMNAIESVRAIDGGQAPATREFSNAECGFSYRDSFFKTPAGKKWIILSVTFRLSSAPRPNLAYRDLAEYFFGRSFAERAPADSAGRHMSKTSCSVLANDLQEPNTAISGHSPKLPDAGPTGTSIGTSIGAGAMTGAPSQSEIRKAILTIRSRKFPDLSKIGTAGSFWKNPIISHAEFDALAAKYPGMPSFPVASPSGHDIADAGKNSANSRVKVPLAWILDKVCGLKGYEQRTQSGGRVALFANQPLVLVAEFGATAADISALADHVAAAVREKTGIEIEREVGSMPVSRF